MGGRRPTWGTPDEAAALSTAAHPPPPSPSPPPRPWHLWSPRVSRRGVYSQSAGAAVRPPPAGAPARGDPIFAAAPPPRTWTPAPLPPRRRARPGGRRPPRSRGGVGGFRPPPPLSRPAPRWSRADLRCGVAPAVLSFPHPPRCPARGRCLDAPRCSGRFLRGGVLLRPRLAPPLSACWPVAPRVSFLPHLHAAHTLRPTPPQSSLCARGV